MTAKDNISFQTTSETLNQQKIIALILCLFLMFMYKESVWDPYFHPERFVVNAPQTSPVAGTQTAAVAPANPSTQFTEPGLTPTAPTPISTTTAAAVVAPAAGTPAVANQTGYPSDAQVAAQGILRVRSSRLSLDIALLGGRAQALSLSDFRSEVGKDQPQLNLVKHVEFAPYPLGVYSGPVNDSWTQYTVVSAPQPGADGIATVPDGGSASVVLSGTLPDGRPIRKTITMNASSYFLDVDVAVQGAAADGSRTMLEWTQLIPKDSPSFLDHYGTSGVVWFDNQKALRESYSKMTTDSQSFPSIRWLAMADKYFMVGLVSPGDLTTGRALKTGDLYRARVEGEDTGLKLKVFAGPKSYRLLEASGFELQRIIDFGWTGIIAAPLLTLLHQLFDIVGNYGLAIILLTILVKLCVYPLNSSAFKQMKAMQDIAPELKRIKESVSDPRQQQVAMMELYKERGVNPLGGCLPILVQMPIFIGLYTALMIAIELRHAPFALWINDLSSQERLLIGGVTIPVMVILFVISMLVQQWMTPSNMDPVQKKVMLVMPLVFGFMFASMPAGLTLYWLTNNVISIGQQTALKREKASKSAFLVTLAVSGAVFAVASVLVLIS